MPILAEKLTLNGSGALTQDTMPITGIIAYVAVDFIATHAAGTTLTIAEKNQPQRSIVTNTGNADFVRYPCALLQLPDGTTVGVYERFYVDNQSFTFTVASGTATAVLHVRIAYIPM